MTVYEYNKAGHSMVQSPNTEGALIQVQEGRDVTFTCRNRTILQVDGLLARSRNTVRPLTRPNTGESPLLPAVKRLVRPT
jgi:hypothetical protein